MKGNFLAAEDNPPQHNTTTCQFYSKIDCGFEAATFGAMELETITPYAYDGSLSW